MKEKTTNTLINRQNGNLLFKLFRFEEDDPFNHVQRNNYFTLVWVTKGSGKMKVDFSEHPFHANTLFSFYPYQPFMIAASGGIQGHAIHFHPEFFCIHRHHQEIGCNGVLFNNLYRQPYVLVDEPLAEAFKTLIGQMSQEMQTESEDHNEVLTAYLKVFLITATRMKLRQQPGSDTVQVNNRHLLVLQELKDAIENNYKKIHTPGDYAALLNISTGALAKTVKTYLNRTLTELIAERIIIEAKRELYLSKKTIREIAFELGYEDEYYFSRFFKSNTEISPQYYRDTVGSGKGIANN